MALSGKRAKIRYTSIAATSSTGEPATLTSQPSSQGGDFVQVNSTARRHWLRDSTGFVLLLNGATVGAANYTINPVQGKFEFNTTGQGAGTYTANIRYLTNTYLTGAQSWSVDTNVNMLDVTSMSTSTGDVQWRTFQAGLSDASMSLERLLSTGDTGPVFYDRINLENDVIVEAVTHDFVRYEGYGLIQSDSVNTDLDGLTVESVTVQITGELYRSSS